MRGRHLILLTLAILLARACWEWPHAIFLVPFVWNSRMWWIAGWWMKDHDPWAPRGWAVLCFFLAMCGIVIAFQAYFLGFFAFLLFVSGIFPMQFERLVMMLACLSVAFCVNCVVGFVGCLICFCYRIRIWVDPRIPEQANYEFEQLRNVIPPPPAANGASIVAATVAVGPIFLVAMVVMLREANIVLNRTIWNDLMFGGALFSMFLMPLPAGFLCVKMFAAASPAEAWERRIEQEDANTFGPSFYH